MTRVVFIPGVMGSVLRDPTVPRDFCQTTVAPRIGRIAATAGLLPPAAFVLKRLIDRLCKLDMSVIWGSLAMLPWLFVPDLWCKRLTQGDGQISPGNVVPDGFETLQNSYTVVISQLKSFADVLEFSYDWRLSNDVNAKRLEERILDRWWKKVVPSEPVPFEDKVSIVAHSMGGLIGRNFLEARSGFRLASRLITGGTPHQGAPESYCGFHRIREPFAKTIDLAVISRLLARLGISLPAVLRRILIPTIMPIDMQVELIRSCSSTIQLLPNFNFVGRGGTAESLAVTYGSMKHFPTGLKVADTIDLLRRNFKDKTGPLNTWLKSVGLQYFPLASTGISTVQRFDADPSSSPSATGSFKSCRTGGAVSDVFRQGSDGSSDDGDGTVPLASARLNAGTHVFPTVFRRLEHGKLFQDLDVRNLCYSILGGPPVTRESEFETLERAGFGTETEMELEYLEMQPLAGQTEAASAFV